MNKSTILLAALATADGDSFSPVQIQKLVFLIDKNIPNLVAGPHFEFKPYDYGPYDKAVYRELEAMSAEGLVEIISNPSFNYRKYRATSEGLERGNSALGELAPKARQYIKSLSEFVRNLNFSELVSAIYQAYPEMQVNSVFRKQ